MWLREITCNVLKKKVGSWVWRCMPLIPAFGRQKQGDHCEFEASLVYILSSRPGKEGYLVKTLSKPKIKQNPIKNRKYFKKSKTHVRPNSYSQFHVSFILKNIFILFYSIYVEVPLEFKRRHQIP